MNIATSRALIELNNTFYSAHAASFSATRAMPWSGWEPLANLLQKKWSQSCTATKKDGGREPDSDMPAKTKRQVLDLACGNLRFEQFLTAQLPDVDFSFQAVDSCEALSASNGSDMSSICYHKIDILDATLRNERPLETLPSCDLSVCFGFMHHIPGQDLRHALMHELVSHTAHDGYMALSFWRFMEDTRLAHKARKADAHAHEKHVATTVGTIDPSQLDEHDHFLGWQNDPAPLRYCHHFTEQEIDELVRSVGMRAHEVMRYDADGASGTLNRYVILRCI